MVLFRLKLAYNKKSLLFVLAAMGVVMLHQVLNIDQPKSELQLPSQIDARETPTKPLKIVKAWPKCERNASAAQVRGFSSLPAHIKDFLFHRHCRHFPMLLDVPDKCGGPKGSSDVFLLLVIKSSPGNYEQREVLRKTWAKERQHEGRTIRRVFISGTSGDEKTSLNELLRAEQKLHRDILQWDFTDTFFNLTLKQVLFLEWLDQNCKNARFLLNGDDDVFANTDNVVEYLRDLNDNDGGKHLFQGEVIENASPFRTSHTKYYVPWQVFAENAYPPYCGGGGFLLSGYSASVIYQKSKDVQLLPIDDVYIAMCLAKAGLRPHRHKYVKIRPFYVPEKMGFYNPCIYKELLIAHRFLPKQIFLMWQQIHNPELKCSISLT